MSDRNEVRQIQLTLRELIKTKGETLKTLCHSIGVSYATIKRWLSDEHVSLQNLSKISQSIGLSFFEVASVANKQKSSFTKPGPDVLSFFKKHLEYFGYYLCLLEKKTPSEIQQIYKLSKEKNEKYLVQLERLGLLEIKDSKRVFVKNQDTLFFGPEIAQLIEENKFKTLRKHGGEKFILFQLEIERMLLKQNLISNDQIKQKDYVADMHTGFLLAQKNYDELIRETWDLIIKYSHQTNVDSKVYAPEELVNFSLCFFIDKFDLLEDVKNLIK